MILKKGSEGSEVRIIQSFLKSLGYNVGSENGSFGDKTDSSVRQYQRNKKILVDGKVGNQTLEFMKLEGLLLSDERGATVSKDLLSFFIERLKIRSEEWEGYIETKNNAEWDDPNQAGWQKEQSDKLVKYMSKIKPWVKGAPYCSAAVGAIIIMALEDCKLQTLKFESIWTAHVMTNVRLLKFKHILSITPSLGCVWLAKFGNTDSGHTGMVIDIKSDELITIEGNTVPGQTVNQQKQRAGDGFFRRKFHKSGRGVLKTQGFLSAENVLKFFVS